MDKTAHSLIRRSFLTEGLPEPLTPASSHLQLFDNYIPDTRLRIRNIRVPDTKKWTHILQQVFSAAEGDPRYFRIAEIYLNDSEYALFERFEGREIRKNRYFHEFDGHEFAFDIYLGPLWGLNEAKVVFRNTDDAENFEPPPFAVLEVTGERFFFDSNLVDRRFDEIREELSRIQRTTLPTIRGAHE